MKNQSGKAEEWRKELRKAFNVAASFDDRSDVDCLIDHAVFMLSRQREEIIRELRRWIKGKNITKDKLREKLNALAVIGGGK